LCDESGTLLIIDDVQAGMGRTGNWFSWQDLNIEPDIASVAKALANGLPIGACLATEEVAGAFQPGDHATTFGGGPVVCAAALATITEIEDRGLLDNALARGQQLRDGLMALDGVSGVRGKGLLLAAVLDDDLAAEVVAMALDNGLIVNAVRPNAVRWAPPLSITGSEIDDAVAIFEESLSAIRRDSDGH
ncbi:MAG: aminotransferase class III-fold pyridoxal phosphate-dependent enzyme, partial [Acidimicrobiia bacterium]|nr:aminotransferase class III-fold pyridoxal phosphate-dependent enzyme [Acidimicrobiia bacterium]